MDGPLTLGQRTAMRVPKLAGLLFIVGGLVLGGCSEPREAGFKLGNRHAKLLEAKEIEVQQLDKELREAEASHPEGPQREAFLEGYRKGIDPATNTLAELYVKTAADELKDASKSLKDEVGGFIDGVLSDIDRRVDNLGSEEHQRDMREVGRHLGRVVKGLAKELKSAAKGFSEEVNKP